VGCTHTVGAVSDDEVILEGGDGHGLAVKLSEMTQVASSLRWIRTSQSGWRPR
jgi:hypothetical protein